MSTVTVISIPDGLSAYITPVVIPKVLNVAVKDEDEDDEMSRFSVSPHVFIEIPAIISSQTPNISSSTFLPLPRTFNRHCTTDWVTLFQEMQDFVFEVAVDMDSPERAWGTDLYWIAYIAAYPTFPQGARTKWDPRMKLCGTFGDYWLCNVANPHTSHARPCTDTCAACITLCDSLWDSFLLHAATMYSGPIISSI